MSNSYNAPTVICPFYVDDVSLRIRCEGVDEAQYVHMIFEDYGKKRSFMKKNCCQFQRRCSIARRLEEKYSDE